MTRRVCAESGCPTISDRTRCDEHTRARDKARGTAAERGYGADYQRTARAWRARIARGDVVTCWRCGLRITDNMHLGHDDLDRSIIRGPEHAHCNLSAAGKARHGIPPGA